MTTKAERTEDDRQSEQELQLAFSPMRIWDKVFETNPKHTKHVSLGSRKFTSIDPYQQIRRATEIFGPVGLGWGWEVRDISYPPDGFMVVVHIRFWWREPHPDPLDAGIDSAMHSFDEIEACTYRAPKNDRTTRCQEMDPNGNLVYRYDEDCVKKATTGAITKALSRLGFNADVFLGGFDDVRYVKKMERKFEEEKAAKVQTETLRDEQHNARGPEDLQPGGGSMRPPKEEPAENATTSEPTEEDVGGHPGFDGAAELQPAPPIDEHTGKPEFYSQLIGGAGENAKRTWRWMADGSADGRRLVWLKWALENYKNQKVRNRIAWILEHEYEVSRG